MSPDPRGAHWQAKRQAAGIPEEKVCERCDRTYSRAEVGRQRLAHWVARRFCGETCRRAALADASREQRGARNPAWKGDAATSQAGRKRARTMYPEVQPCEVCGDDKAERHHRDGNTLNNSAENIGWLCRKHHIEVEDRMAYRRAVPA